LAFDHLLLSVPSVLLPNGKYPFSFSSVVIFPFQRVHFRSVVIPFLTRRLAFPRFLARPSPHHFTLTLNRKRSRNFAVFNCFSGSFSAFAFWQGRASFHEHDKSFYPLHRPFCFPPTVLFLQSIGFLVVAFDAASPFSFTPLVNG